MNKLVVIFLFFFTSINLNAQSLELLSGKWVFKKVLNKVTNEVSKKSLKNDIIDKMTFEFNDNGNFIAFAYGQDMKGKWKLSEKLKIIVLSTEKEEYKLSIIKLTKSELILKFGLGEFLMKKI